MARQQQQEQQPRMVRDLSGQRVRMTYYRRDPSFSHTVGTPDGSPGPFDRNETVEGTLCCLNHVGSVYLWGLRLDDGTPRFGFLQPTDPLEHENTLGTASQWDGRTNGSYLITAL